jgi:hypothetical protein
VPVKTRLHPSSTRRRSMTTQAWHCTTSRKQRTPLLWLPTSMELILPHMDAPSPASRILCWPTRELRSFPIAILKGIVPGSWHPVQRILINLRSVDFIWGFSTAFFHQCMIVSNTPGACVAAQSRQTATTVGGYVFDKSVITYSSTYGSSFGLSYLGRPYSEFSIAVYTNCFIDKHISAAGWSVWSTSSPQTSGGTSVPSIATLKS